MSAQCIESLSIKAHHHLHFQGCKSGLEKKLPHEDPLQGSAGSETDPPMATDLAALPSGLALPQSQESMSWSDSTMLDSQRQAKKRNQAMGLGVGWKDVLVFTQSGVQKGEGSRGDEE